MYILFYERAPTGSSFSILALESGSVVVELGQIPNQPIVFKVLFHLIFSEFFLFYKKTDPTQKSRSEDEIIAWTWRTFIESNGSDPYILLRMPMTKVRHMNI